MGPGSLVYPHSHAPGSSPLPAPPRSPIPRPPSIRPPHRKLFLINENGKLGPHITSRDVLGSGNGGNGSRCLGQHSPGFERPRSGRVLLPAQASWVLQREPGPLKPPAGGARVRRPRPRPGPWRCRRRAASVNSLRHLATASGNAARRSPGVRPLGPAAPLSGKPHPALQGIVSGELGTCQPGGSISSSPDHPSPVTLRSCPLTGGQPRYCVQVQASGRCPSSCC